MTEAPEPQKRVTYLGTVSLEPGEAVAFSIPENASPEEIAAALAAVEAKKIADALAETKRLEDIFLGQAAVEKGPA